MMTVGVYSAICTVILGHTDFRCFFGDILYSTFRQSQWGSGLYPITFKNLPRSHSENEHGGTCVGCILAVLVMDRPLY